MGEDSDNQTHLPSKLILSSDFGHLILNKFLMWLNAHCQTQSRSLSYADLLKHFRLTSVSARRSQHDIMFIRNVFSGRISSAFILQAFCLSVPCRTTRQQTSTLLNVPFARVNAVKSGLFVRLPRQLNVFFRECPCRRHVQ